MPVSYNIGKIKLVSYRNHLLHILNRVFPHLHDMLLHRLTMRDFKRRPQVGILQEAAKFRLVNFLEWLVTCDHPFSEKPLKRILIPVSFLNPSY
jgi:hypothetical protein